MSDPHARALAPFVHTKHTTPPACLIDPAEAWDIAQGIESGAVPVTLDKDPCDHFYQDVTATAADGWAFVITCRGYGYLAGITAPDGKRATFDDIWDRGDADPWCHLKDYGVSGGWGIGDEYVGAYPTPTPDEIAALPIQMALATLDGLAASVAGDHTAAALHFVSAALFGAATEAVPESLRPDVPPIA